MPDQCARVTHRKSSGLEMVDDTLRQRQQPLEIGDMAARFLDHLGDVGLGQTLELCQPLIGARFLDRVEIFALNILDQRQRHHVAIR